MSNGLASRFVEISALGLGTAFRDGVLVQRMTMLGPGLGCYGAGSSLRGKVLELDIGGFNIKACEAGPYYQVCFEMHQAITWHHHSCQSSCLGIQCLPRLQESTVRHCPNPSNCITLQPRHGDRASYRCLMSTYIICSA